MAGGVVFAFCERSVATRGCPLAPAALPCEGFSPRRGEVVAVCASDDTECHDQGRNHIGQPGMFIPGGISLVPRGAGVDAGQGSIRLG